MTDQTSQELLGLNAYKRALLIDKLEEHARFTVPALGDRPLPAFVRLLLDDLIANLEEQELQTGKPDRKPKCRRRARRV